MTFHADLGYGFLLALKNLSRSSPANLLWPLHDDKARALQMLGK